VIARQHLENTLENAVLGPPAETLMDDLPIPEALGKITQAYTIRGHPPPGRAEGETREIE
jgi:hypothetical protein